MTDHLLAETIGAALRAQQEHLSHLPNAVQEALTKSRGDIFIQPTAPTLNKLSELLAGQGIERLSFKVANVNPSTFRPDAVSLSGNDAGFSRA
jgi:hypothetical protein